MKTMAGRLRKLGGSVRMAAQTGATSNLWRYMPVIYGEEENEEQVETGTEAEGKQASNNAEGADKDNASSSPQKQAEAEPTQPQSVLAGLQDELRQLTASPADFTGKDDKINELKAKVAQVLTKIKKLQNAQLLVKSFDQATPVTSSL